MSIDNPAADEIHDIEISIDGAGLEPAALDEATRRLAERLRSLPHENVGIIADPAPATPGGTAPARTLGVVVMSLRKSILPKAIEVVQGESRSCNGRRFTVKGANEVRLDCTGTLSSEIVTAWLHAVMKS